MTRRAINKEGLELVKSFEGCKLTSYLCPAKILTIGFGSTGPHVKPGMTITKDQAEELLRSDLRRFEDCVSENAPTATDNQFSAMVSFAFNVGCAAFEESTLLRLHRQGKYDAAAGQFGRWTRGGGKVLPGLIRRREAEAALYRKG
jgi:lysozyme